MSSLSLTCHSKVFHRLGAAAFAFFLVKGILWLLAPFVFMYLL